MSGKLRIVFMCAANCCRSQIAETLMRQIAGDRFEVFSAGYLPAGYVHPLATETMKRRGLSTSGQHSKSWHEIIDREFDLVVILCDAVDIETDPPWLGNPLVIHWPMPDPSFAPGSPQQRIAQAEQVVDMIEDRLEQIAGLDFERTDRPRLERELLLIHAG
jgi:arsenate reductase